MKNRVLVLDVAGVIIDVPTRLDAKTWLRINPKFLNVPPVASLTLMRRVVQKFDHTYLVSAVSDDDIALHTRRWLDHWQFWSECGVPSDNLLFCSPGAEKKREIINGLPRVDIFIDDRSENVAELTSHVNRSVLYDRGEGERAPTGATVVRSWEDILSVS